MSREANLLLSSVHLLELARGGKDMVRVGEALDELDVVWLLPSDQLEEHEVTHLLLQSDRPIRLRHAPPMPTAGSFVGAFGTLPVETVGGVLRAPSISSYLRAVIEDDANLKKLETMSGESAEISRRLLLTRNSSIATCKQE